MTSDTRRILDLLAQGKITADEAEQLIAALNSRPADEAAAGSAPPETGPDPEKESPRARFFRISVEETKEGRAAEKVNIRIPLSIVRGGVRLGAMMPGCLGDKMNEHFRNRGINLDFSKLDQSRIESILADMGEVLIDLDEGKAKVRMSCE